MKQITTFFLFLFALCICTTAVAVKTVTISYADFAAVSDKPYSLTKDGVTIEVTKGTKNSDNHSVFKGQTLTLSSSYAITKIEFTCTANNTSKWGPGCFSTETGSYTFGGKIGTWTGSAGSVTFTASTNQVRITQTVVTIDDGGPDLAGLAWSQNSYEIVQNVDEFEAPTFSKTTDATVTFNSDNTSVAKVSTSGVITLAGGVGTAVISASSPANTSYAAGEATCTITILKSATYSLATSIVSGKKYILVVETSDLCLASRSIESGKTYGYLPVILAKKVGEDIVTATGNEIEITGEAGDYTLTDAEGRVMWMTGTYTSFQLGNVADGANVGWTISIAADGVATITNNDKGKTVQYSTEHGSFGSYEDITNVLPYLYTEKKTDAIKEINSNAPADSRRFNVLGQPVGNDYKGIVISNGRMTISK